MYVLMVLVFISWVYYLKYKRSRRELYELANILPDVGGLPVIGHTHWFVGGPERLFNNIWTLHTKLTERADLTKVWIGTQLYIIPTDLDDVQKVLENCLEKDYSYKFLKTWLGNGLFVAPVEVWKVHRRLLLPVFNNRLIEEYVDVFGEQGTVLVNRLQQLVGEGEFDVYEYITACMLDIVFETAMGERMEVQRRPDTPYLRARKTVMSIINMRMFKAWLQPDPLFNLTSHSALLRESIDLTHRFTDEVVRKKRLIIKNDNSNNNKKGRKDILELLLSKNMNFTNEQLREHIDSITIAGNDTTALVIAYTLMMLGIHQHEQDKVYNELKSVFGESMRSPTKEDLNKLEYLERVLKETMRLYTVVPLIARKTQKELKLSTCTIPAGVGCGISPFMMHRSKKVWGADADEFKPDRFLPENSAKRHSCAYLPFSYGVRNCIGRHFGMLAMKSVVANILRSYEVTAKPFHRLKIEILLFPVKGHLISLKRRTKYVDENKTV